eukprot:7376958-Prymnesium_polylepis.1
MLIYRFQSGLRSRVRDQASPSEIRVRVVAGSNSSASAVPLRLTFNASQPGVPRVSATFRAAAFDYSAAPAAAIPTNRVPYPRHSNAHDSVQISLTATPRPRHRALRRGHT